MSTEEIEYLENRLEQIAKQQQKQSSQLDRLSRVLLDDEEAGIRGLGTKMKNVKQRVEKLEEDSNKIKWSVGVIVSVGTIVINFFLYYGKEFLNWIGIGTGKA